MFSQHTWTELIKASERDAEEASTARPSPDEVRKTGSTSSDDDRVGRTFLRHTGGDRPRDTTNIASIEGSCPSLSSCTWSPSRGSCSSSTQPPHWSWMKGCSHRICVLREGRGSRTVRDDDRPPETVVGQREKSRLASVCAPRVASWCPNEFLLSRLRADREADTRKFQVFVKKMWGPLPPLRHHTFSHSLDFSSRGPPADATRPQQPT